MKIRYFHTVDPSTQRDVKPDWFKEYNHIDDLRIDLNDEAPEPTIYTMVNEDDLQALWKEIQRQRDLA